MLVHRALAMDESVFCTCTKWNILAGYVSNKVATAWWRIVYSILLLRVSILNYRYCTLFLFINRWDSNQYLSWWCDHRAEWIGISPRPIRTVEYCRALPPVRLSGRPSVLPSLPLYSPQYLTDFVHISYSHFFWDFMAHWNFMNTLTEWC